MNADPPSYRGRFAPSPTGPLHLGSLLAALASYLDARSRGGTWLLRVEDLDTTRCRAHHVDGIFRTLERYGLQWDGTPVLQAARREHYAAALTRLWEYRRVYRCTCSRKDLRDRPRNISGEVHYPGSCRYRAITADHPHAVRLAVDPLEIHLDDQLQGRYQQHLARDVGDFILQRRDGVYAYQLAVVVDDALQDITTVVRGTDLLDSTPRQIFLQRLLGYPTPAYLHLPILCDAIGAKLGKQTLAAPADRYSSSLALTRLLDWLNCPPPTELHGAPPAELVTWAVSVWRAAPLPHMRRITVATTELSELLLY